MNFLATIAAKFRSLTGAGVSPTQFLRGEDNAGRGAEMTNALQQSVWVYACVTTMAQQVAQIPFRISRGERGNKNRVDSGPLVDLLAQPHPMMDRFTFWQLLVTWFCLRGESFIVATDAANQVLAFNNAGRNGGKIKRLAILPPDMFWHLIEDHELKGWRYTGNNFLSPVASQVILPEEVLLLRQANPHYFWRGLPPLQAAMLAAETDFAAGSFMRGLMLNNADTGVIVTVEGWPTDEQREQMLSALRERKRKAGTADRPMLLGGGAKVQPPTIAKADLEVLANRKFARQEICAVFGVPQEILGFSEDANKAVATQALENWINNNIAPFCARLEACMQPLVQAFGADLVGWFDVDSLPVRQAARRARFVTAKDVFAGMGIPVSELNEAFDLGLDDRLAHWDASYLPSTLVKIGDNPPTPAPDATDAGDPEAGAAGDPVNEALAGATRALIILEKSRVQGSKFQVKDTAPPATQPETRNPEPGTPTPAHRAAADNYAALIAGSVRNKVGKLGKFFFEQRGRVLASLAQHYKTAPDAPTRNPELETRNSDEGQFGDLFDVGTETEILFARLGPLLTADLGAGFAQVATELSLTDFALPPEKAIEFLQTRRPKIQGVNEETFAQLRNTLTEGLQGGESYDDLAKRVKEVFTDATDTRAEMIAVTETNTAMNTGRFESMVEAGVTHKGWLTSGLEGTRATHLACAAQGPVPMAEAFINGLQHPGDPNGPAGEVINCRCHLIALPTPEPTPEAAP